MDEVYVCSHCRKTVKLSLGIGFDGFNIGIVFHWIGKYFVIDLVLRVPESSRCPILYSRAYSESVV